MISKSVYCLSLIGALSLNLFCGACWAQSQQPGYETPQLAPPEDNLRGPMNNDFTRSTGGGNADGSWRGAANPPPSQYSPSPPYSGGNNAPYGGQPQGGYGQEQPQAPLTPYNGGKYKNKNGLVGTTVGAPEKATKSAVGLTDKSAKTAVGVTGKAAKTSVGVPAKAVKEMFKAIF